MNTIYLAIVKWIISLTPAKQIVAVLVLLCLVGGSATFFLFLRNDTRDAICDREKEHLRLENVALRKEKDSAILSIQMLGDAKINEQALKVNAELKEQIERITSLNNERDRLKKTNERVIYINNKTIQKLKNAQK